MRAAAVQRAFWGEEAGSGKWIWALPPSRSPRWHGVAPCMTRPVVWSPRPPPTAPGQSLDPRAGHASPRRRGRRCSGDSQALSNAPVPLDPGRPSATRTASTSGRGTASARTPIGATVSVFCSSVAATRGLDRRAQGAHAVSARSGLGGGCLGRGCLGRGLEDGAGRGAGLGAARAVL